MIKNEREYRVTRTQAQRFAAAIDAHEAVGAIRPDYSLSAMNEQLSDLQEELSEYEKLSDGAITHTEMNSLADLPLVLIRARIAQKLTQEQLAKKLGAHEQQVQRWEADDYRKAGFARLLKVAKALNLELKTTVRLAGAK